MSCPVCGRGFGRCPEGEGSHHSQSSYYAWGERVCRACNVWSLRAVVQHAHLGRIARLAPETLPA